MQLCWTGTQPLGIDNIEPDAAARYMLRAPDPLVRPDAIRCCVRGCTHWLARRARGPHNPAAYCPDHRVSVSLRPTYVYADYRENCIVNAPHLQLVRELKVESWRLGHERSEDA